ncbi:RNA polymerase sigma factor [Verrucomicrobiota bacterium]
MKNTEHKLITKAQMGDLGAFEELMHMHIQRVQAYVAIRLPLPHLVDEITHETFIFAYNHIKDLSDDSNFGAWIKAVAYNKVRAEVLRYARERTNKEKYLVNLIVQMSNNKLPEKRLAVIEHLEDCMRQLPKHMKELLKFRYYFGSSSEEIAEKFDRSTAWVRTSLFRVRKTLKQCIERKMTAETA